LEEYKQKLQHLEQEYQKIDNLEPAPVKEKSETEPKEHDGMAEILAEFEWLDRQMELPTQPESLPLPDPLLHHNLLCNLQPITPKPPKPNAANEFKSFRRKLLQTL
jgi:hypothetical protein